jgi:hypothetical protein
MVVEEIKKSCVTHLDILCITIYFKFTENLEYRTHKIFMI